MLKPFSRFRKTILWWTIAAVPACILAISPRAFAVSPVASGGDRFSIVLKSDGTVWGWGANTSNQLNDGTGETSPPPVRVLDIDTVSQLSTGLAHTLAVRPDGTVWAWGGNFSGELGGGHRYSPPNGQFRMVASDNFSDAEAVAAGAGFSFVVDGGKRLWAWGRNTFGQLGDGSTNDSLIPVPVSGMTDVIAVAAGSDHTAAVKAGGSVWAWGRNTFGQIGDGTEDDRQIPVQVANLTGVIAVSTGSAHTLALKSDGTVWAWGYNGSGQLGNNSVFNRKTPVRSGELTDVTMISAGADHNLALKSDGSVWSWGSNYSGQIGDGTEVNRYTPVQIGSLANIITIAAGTSHSLAIDHSGKVWQWGSVWISSNIGTSQKTPQPVPGPDSGDTLNVYEPSAVIQGEAVAGAWTQDLAVSTSPYDQLSIDIVADNSGGSYTVWDDEWTASVWVQHFDAHGKPLWPSVRAVAEAPAMTPRVAADGSGGILIAWQDGRNGLYCYPGVGLDCDIYAQRINSAGQSVWASEGVPVVTDSSYNFGSQTIVSDGQGGAIVVWLDPRPPGCCSLFAQRIDTAGQIEWQTNGIPISPKTGIYETILIEDNAGGALVAWYNDQVGHAELAIQRISASGQLPWGLTGTVVGSPSHDNFMKMISDGAGGAILVYSVNAGIPGAPWTDLRAQRVLSDGAIAWQEGGIWVSRAPRSQINPQLVSDGMGGAIITWENEPEVENSGCYGVFEECDIFAQHINAAGEILWQEDGIPITSARHSQHSPIIVADGAGGAVVAWQDCRYYSARDTCASSMDIYVQRVNASGSALWPLDGVPLTRELGNQGEAPGFPHNSVIRGIADTAGGATFVWPDGRETFCSPAFIDSNCDVFAQRVILGYPPNVTAMPWTLLLLLVN